MQATRFQTKFIQQARDEIVSIERQRNQNNFVVVQAMCESNSSLAPSIQESYGSLDDHKLQEQSQLPLVDNCTESDYSIESLPFKKTL